MFPRRRQLGDEEEEEEGQRRKSGHTYVHRSTEKTKGFIGLLPKS